MRRAFCITGYYCGSRGANPECAATARPPVRGSRIFDVPGRRAARTARRDSTSGLNCTSMRREREGTRLSATQVSFASSADPANPPVSVPSVTDSGTAPAQTRKQTRRRFGCGNRSLHEECAQDQDRTALAGGNAVVCRLALHHRVSAPELLEGRSGNRRLAVLYRRARQRSDTLSAGSGGLNVLWRPASLPIRVQSMGRSCAVAARIAGCSGEIMVRRLWAQEVFSFEMVELHCVLVRRGSWRCGGRP